MESHRQAPGNLDLGKFGPGATFRPSSPTLEHRLQEAVIHGQGDDLARGQQLGIFAILEPLGAGVMGQVYRARDINLDRDVAIKVPPKDFAQDAERLHRFQCEAKSLAPLNHPIIAQIHSVDHIDGTHFLSLELVPGESLDERLARGRLPFEDALKVCRDVADGKKFVMVAGGYGLTTGRLDVHLNLRAELKKALPRAAM